MSHLTAPAMLATALLLSNQARASEGPWSTAPGLHNIYLGTFVERFSCFTADRPGSVSCGDSSTALPGAVARTGLKAFYRTGLSRRVDLAFSAPLLASIGSGDASSDTMQPTIGVGTIQGRVRATLGDAGPVTFGMGLGVESGAAHAKTRGRITNLGDGTSGAVATLYSGTHALLGSTFYTASTDISYVYRFKIDESSAGRLPGDELRFSSLMVFALSQRFGVGASLDGQLRLWGEDLNARDLRPFGTRDDSLRWAALQAQQIKGGVRGVLYPEGTRPYMLLGVYQALWAWNNPVDTLFVELAVGFDLGRGES